ncbi:MAG: 50S ribosomal protein L4 [Candidatus Bipolaricaulota bacterium]|jgi:large subunit ribosomal protein L4|nr:50S ribosomal protein L4 [Candidatus Bipolaricaulota bacterium]
MVEAKVYSFAEAGGPQTVALDERLFGGEVNKDLLYRMVRVQMANRRQGTSCTKTRGEVRGGGRKPWRQKGTGRARQGSRRSPLWVGGGTTFGPKPRDYSMNLTKKMRAGALVSALSDRAQEGRVVLVDRMGFEEPKTKSAVALLARLGVSGSALIVVSSSEYDRAVKKSFTNLRYVKCIAGCGVNVYDVLRHDFLVMTVGAVEELRGRF